MSYIYISEKPKVLLVSCESFTYSYKISDDGEIPAFVSSKMGLLDVDIIYYDRQKIKVSVWQTFTSQILPVANIYFANFASVATFASQNHQWQTFVLLVS